MRWRRITSSCVLGLAVATTAAGCGTGEEEMQRELEQAAADAREAIDAIAADLGQNPQVREDVIIDCVPGDRGSGKTLSYAVAVDVRGGALDRLSSMAVSYERKGWGTELRGDGSRLTLRDEAVSVVASVFAEDGRANIVGNGICVE